MAVTGAVVVIVCIFYRIIALDLIMHFFALMGPPRVFPSPATTTDKESKVNRIVIVLIF